MRKDLIQLRPVYSSFLTCDKDVQKILKTLFIESKPYSDFLKRLLIINNKDCLSNKTEYQQIIDKFSLGDLMNKGYIRLSPKILRGTHEEIKSYIVISLDNFSPVPDNPEFLNYIINFDIICYEDAWTLEDYKIRPLMICGYIDGILNSITNKNKMNTNSHKPQIKLSGIGSYQMITCQETVLNEDLGMYTLSYAGMHFNEDIRSLSLKQVEQ